MPGIEPNPPPRWRLEVHDELPSTSDAILTRTNEPEGLAILARRQTKGRGTHGRAWIAPEGNLNLSILLHPTHPSPWALLVGAALHQAVAQYLPDPTILTLKWPNDLLLNGGKLAGILIEAGPGWLVIGVGVNLRDAPALPDRPTASLAGVVDPETAAASFLAALSHWLAIEAAEGFRAVRAAWLAAAHPLGTPLRVALPDTLIEGFFAGLTDHGALLLQTPAGLRQLHAGTVI
jgi:BirA family biotin operon repressor/biotin-[acetyl-CoA-carboxylase] ligase